MFWTTGPGLAAITGIISSSEQAEQDFLSTCKRPVIPTFMYFLVNR